ncbi:hypothetical protein EG827_13730 [bacterium]|nr:hypothetical protein [bacterium]
MLVSAVAACKGSSSSGTDGGTVSQAQGVVIGPGGGTAVITEQAGEVAGAKVYIPGNALETEEVVSLRVVPLPAGLPSRYTAAGPCIGFSPDGISFSQPVSLYLPYTDTNNDGIVDGKAVSEDMVRVLYFNEKIGQWEEMPLQSVDRAANLAVAVTRHFSTYLVAINTGDTQSGDTGSQSGDATALESGDCLVGDGNLVSQSNTDSCFYYNLTVTRRSSGMLALVDRHATYVTTGIPAVVSSSGDSATFDASSAFSKVLASGDARLWNWECDFIKEHTQLKDYEVLDDYLSTTGTSGASGGIACTIEALDANMVKISWQINVNEQILHITSAQGGGHCLVIRFRATYL